MKCPGTGFVMVYPNKCEMWRRFHWKGEVRTFWRSEAQGEEMTARDDYPLLAFYDENENSAGEECARALDEIDRLRAELDAAQLRSIEEVRLLRQREIDGWNVHGR